MRRMMFAAVGAAMGLGLLGGCASSSGNQWADACQRDYERNRQAATAAGALVGAAAGAAVAKNDAQGAAIGALAGGLIGHSVATKDDPCGYGFGGYPYDSRYGYWDERNGRWRHG